MSFAPRLPASLLIRERLLDRLDEYPEPAVIVVRAPAGGGKTTLVADWVSRRGRAGVWVTLDGSAARRLSFWARVVGAFVDSGVLAPDSILRNLVMSPEMAGELRTALRRGLASLTPGTVLALDDYHSVDDESVHDDLRWLLAEGVPLEVVIASRALTPFERPDWRAQLDTRLIGPTELAFDLAETRAAARSAGLDEAAGVALHEGFGGWPLAIRATTVELASHPGMTLADAIERVRSTSTGELLAAAEPTPFVEFLLRISIARVVTAELARELGGEGADHFLKEAEEQGLGAWSRDGGRHEFALQPYLRSHLAAEFDRRMPLIASRTRIAHGRDLAARGLHLEAIRQFAAAGDWESVSDVGLVAYSDLLLLYGPEVVDILSGADPAELRRHPLLVVLQLAFDSLGARLSRDTLLHRANVGIALVQARLGKASKDRVALLYALMGAQRFGGHYDAARDTAGRLAAALSTLSADGERANAGLRSPAWVHAATSYFYSESPIEAEEMFRVGRDAARADGRPWVELHATSMMLLMAAMRGDHAALQPALEAARAREHPLGWRGTYSAAGFHLAEAYLALESFDASAAHAQLAELAPHESTIEHWPLLARVRGLAHLVAGEGHAGLAALAADVSSHAGRPPTSGAMTTLLAVTRADLLLAEGEPHRAARVLRSVRRSPAAALALARVDLALGRHEHAVANAAPVAWTEARMPRSQAEALLVTAVATARLGRPGDASTAIRRAIDLLDQGQIRRPLMMVPRRELAGMLIVAGFDPNGVLDGVPDVFPSPEEASTLTIAELRVLERLHDSGNAEQIADELYLSINTVKTHLRSVYRKLGVRTRDEALAVAALRGLIDPGDD